MPIHLWERNTEIIQCNSISFKKHIQIWYLKWQSPLNALSLYNMLIGSTGSKVAFFLQGHGRIAWIQPRDGNYWVPSGSVFGHLTCPLCVCQLIRAGWNPTRQETKGSCLIPIRGALDGRPFREEQPEAFCWITALCLSGHTVWPGAERRTSSGYHSVPKVCIRTHAQASDRVRVGIQCPGSEWYL